MATEIKVPSLGESVTSATVARWLKQAGDAVAADEPLVELETDKVTVDVTAPAAARLTQIAADAGAAPPSPAPTVKPPRTAETGEERVRMTRLRRTIAIRLKEAQNTAAMLTTFNEVDMSAIMTLRTEYRDAFEKKRGVRLGFMSF